MVRHMKLYHKFRNSSLDISLLGLFTGSEVSESVYTPTGARIVGWVQENGAHFCQIEGFGGMVFAVDPNATPGDCIHPVAASMTDFLALLCACRDASVILGAYRWSSRRFSEKIAAVPADFRRKSVLRAVANTYKTPEIADPYGYITGLQHEFDYTSLPLHPDYYEWCPIRPGMLKWDVGFGTGFADYCEKDQAGQEMPLNRYFTWADEKWCVPAIYLCEHGIIVDSYLEVDSGRIDTFMDKWGSKDTASLTIEEQMLRELDDPLSIEVIGSLEVNDRPIPRRQTICLTWNPRTDNPWQARRTLEHYKLDREKGYLLRREFFLRRGNNPPIRTMQLHLSAEPMSIPGQRFIAPRPGESITINHPITGAEHRMTVSSLTREALDPNFLSNHPCCYTRLGFNLEPPIGKDLIAVVDCDPGDPVDGGISAQRTVNFPVKTPVVGHWAVSSLRYTPADQVTWRTIFRQRTREDQCVSLLP